jgi:hypothetical protein
MIQNTRCFPRENESRQEHNDIDQKKNEKCPFSNQMPGPVEATGLWDTRCGMTIAGIDVVDLAATSG